jgi:hypothetical protein
MAVLPMVLVNGDRQGTAVLAHITLKELFEAGKVWHDEAWLVEARHGEARHGEAWHGEAWQVRIGLFRFGAIWQVAVS